MYRSIHLYWYRYRLSFSITVSFYWHRYGVFLKPYRKNRYWCIYITLSLSHWLSFNLPPLSPPSISHTPYVCPTTSISPLSLFFSPPSLTLYLSFHFITLSFLFSFIHSRVISLIFFLCLSHTRSLLRSLSASYSLSPSPSRFLTLWLHLSSLSSPVSLRLFTY